MAEIDTRPLESVQAALNLFELRSDQSRFSSPDRNGLEIDVVTKELATYKLQLEVKENENKQANLKLEALQKAMRELSEKHDKACLDSHHRILTELEADNGAITSHQSETASECQALREELTVVRGELDAVKGANAYVLGEVESMETRRIVERENTREALRRILELNDAVLSSAVAAIRGEEERSVFLQEVTMELLSSDRNLEVIRSQEEMVESMEEELLAKALEIEYLWSELKQLKELYVSSSGVFDTAGRINTNDQVPKTAAKDQEQEPDGASPHAPEAGTCFLTEISREDDQVVASDDTNMQVKMPEDVSEDKEAATEVYFVTESLKNVNSNDKDTNTGMPENLAENQEPQAEPAAPNSAVYKDILEAADTVFATEIVTEISKDDDDGEFYTKEIGEGDKFDGGYVLVAAKKAEADGDALHDGNLDAAHAEISDLRFSLEEAVRRAELAEEAKAALERELREEIQKKQRPTRPRAPTEDVCQARDANAPASPARPRPTPSRRSAPPRCLTLGKVLNMKYK